MGATDMERLGCLLLRALSALRRLLQELGELKEVGKGGVRRKEGLCAEKGLEQLRLALLPLLLGLVVRL